MFSPRSLLVGRCQVPPTACRPARYTNAAVSGHMPPSSIILLDTWKECGSRGPTQPGTSLLPLHGHCRLLRIWVG
eukprot:604175-Rhodomonas_salina.2